MRHVLALDELGSFARAAVALDLSQPALSRSVQGLERKIGTRIFLRSTRGIVPTDIGGCSSSARASSSSWPRTSTATSWATRRCGRAR